MASDGSSAGDWSLVDDDLVNGDQPESSGHDEGSQQAGDDPEHSAGYAHCHRWWTASDHAGFYTHECCFLPGCNRELIACRMGRGCWTRQVQNPHVVSRMTWSALQC